LGDKFSKIYLWPENSIDCWAGRRARLNGAGWFDSRVMFIPDGESDLQVGIIYGNLGPIVMA
jgi:hypothetical protein